LCTLHWPPGASANSTPRRLAKCAAGRSTRRAYSAPSTAPPWARSSTSSAPSWLAGTGRTAIERLGAEVEELRLEDEKRYVDMTPAIFVFAAIAMAIRYISLGLDDQNLYVLSGIFFALMYGLRPFFFKMQRPRDN
jgi:hypothetical protein